MLLVKKKKIRRRHFLAIFNPLCSTSLYVNCEPICVRGKSKKIGLRDLGLYCKSKEIGLSES